MKTPDAFRKSRIYEIDSIFYGMSESELVSNAGEALADQLIKRFSVNKKNEISMSILCGLGNNGADGIACANHLHNKRGSIQSKIQVNVYIIGRQQDFKTKEIEEQFKDLKKNQKNNVDNFSINIKQDAYAENITTSDIVIEALLGIGITGKLRKRFKDVINKLARMKAIKIAVDHPTPGYKPDEIYSFLVPKTKKAKLLNINLPKEVGTYVGPGLIHFLHKPGKTAYKRKTGELLVIGGSSLFHGAPIMSIKAASKFIGSIFFYTHPENRDLIKENQMELEEFVSLRNQDLEKYIEYVDVVLAGPGLEDDLINQSILTHLMNKYPDKTFVLDAYAIALTNPKRNLFNTRGYKNCILTPHRGELRHIFDEPSEKGLEGRLKRFCVENECMLVLKGSTDLLFNQEGETKMNTTGNPGMAKGGTGDILAGMVAALATKNDRWEALQAGVFLSGLAGDIAKAKYGYNYSATDEIPLLQEAYKRALEYGTK